MSIENTLNRIDESLKQIVSLLSNQSAPTAEAQQAQEKKTRAKKSDTAAPAEAAPVVVEEKKEVPAPAAATQQPATTVPTATAPAVVASETPWKDVLTAIQELNKSEKPGHGRDGVLAVLKQFGLEGQKVPKLETLGKHAEVLAFVKSLMTADAADDLGL